MGWIIANLLNGKSKDNVLGGPSVEEWASWEMDEEMSHPLVWNIINKKYKERKPGIPGGIVGSGYVISCLESALWAFESTDNFKDGALKAVNLGNDADTTGAVYGQIAGAYYGLNGIPKEWVDKIIKIDEIKTKARQLYELSKNVSS
jgi:ADP-ribosylglycohydrolase